MKPDKVIEEIKKLIQETQEDNTSISDRVEAQEKITGYLVFLAEEEAKAFREARNAYTDRRIAESQYIYESTDSATKAKESAASECKEFRRKEVQTEVEHERIKLFRMAVQKHIDAMLSHTQSLKWEARNVEKQ